MTTRLGWVGALTAIVILAASQVLYEYGPPSSFPDTLHDVALATISGEPLGREGALAAVLDVVLAVYALVVFATLAGTLGAFFLRPADPTAPAAPGATARP